MNNPCDADILIGKKELRHYNLLKWIVFGMLGALLLLASIKSCGLGNLSAPTLVGPTDIIPAGVVDLNGTAEPGSTVGVWINDIVIGTTEVDENGQWKIQTGALRPGQYDVVAYAVDPEGNQVTTAASDTLRLVVGATVTLFGPSGTVAPGSQSFNGTSHPNSLVDIVVNGTSISSAESDENGNWSLTSGDFQPGAYTATAYALDADGNRTASSNEIDWIVGDGTSNGDADTGGTDGEGDGAMAAPAPILLGVSDLAAPGSITLGGNGEPNSQLELLINNVRVGLVDVDVDGNWSYQTDALETGEYTASAWSLDADGNRVSESSNVSWVVGNVALAKPTLSLPQGDIDPQSVTLAGTGTPGTSIELLRNGISIGATEVDGDGRWAIQTSIDSYRNQFEAVGYAPDGSEIGRTAPLTLLLPAAAADLGFGNAPTFGEFAVIGEGQNVADLSWFGTGEAGATIEVYASGVPDPIASTTVGDDGLWEIDSEITLAPGDYDLNVRMIAPDGVVLDSFGPTALTVPAIGAEALSDAPRIVRIEGGRLSADIVTIYGNAGSNAQIEVLVNGNSNGLTNADADGNWQQTISLAPGEHNALVRSAQGESAATVFALGNNGIGVTVNTIDTNSSDNNFVAAGTSAPGTQVELYLDNTLVGRADADGAGNWVYNGSAEQGVHTLRAQSPTADGGALSSSNVNFGIGADAPLAITGISGSFGSAQFFGRAPAGSQVQLIIDNQLVATVTTRDDGTWDFGGNYENGEHYITARQLNPTTGQVAVSSSMAPFTIQGEATVGTESGLLQIVFAGADANAVRRDRVDLNGFLIDGPAVHIILDSSYSMLLDLPGDQRLEAADPASRLSVARNTLNNALNSLPDGVPVSLRAFGHIEGDFACAGALELPVQPLNKGQALGVLNSIEPKKDSNTPLAESIALSLDDLSTVGRKKVIVILTDGEETCDGDPLAAVQTLVDAGEQVFTLNVVGLAIADETVKAQLQELADLGGGRFFDAQSGDQLTSALSETLLTSYRVTDALGNVTATGVVGGTPLRLPPGRYQVDVFSAEPATFNLIIRSGRTAYEQID